MAEPKYVNCWTTSTVVFFIQGHRRVGNARKWINDHNLGFVPVDLQSYFRSLFLQDAYCFHQLVHAFRHKRQLVGKVSIREDAIAQFESKSKSWGRLCHDVVYDDVAQFGPNGTTLPNPWINSEERASSAVYLDAAFFFVMEALQRVYGIYLASRWTSRWPAEHPGRKNRKQLGSQERRWMLSVETLWFSWLLDGQWIFSL